MGTTTLQYSIYFESNRRDRRRIQDSCFHGTGRDEMGRVPVLQKSDETSDPSRPVVHVIGWPPRFRSQQDETGRLRPHMRVKKLKYSFIVKSSQK